MKNFIFLYLINNLLSEVEMKKNMGNTDRALRLIIGLILIAVGFFYQTWWGVIGIIPLATAFLNWCPAYVPFGISTCKTEDVKE